MVARFVNSYKIAYYPEPKTIRMTKKMFPVVPRPGPDDRNEKWCMTRWNLSSFWVLLFLNRAIPYIVFNLISSLSSTCMSNRLHIYRSHLIFDSKEESKNISLKLLERAIVIERILYFFSCWGHARYFYGFVIDQDLLLFRKHSPSNTLREHHHGSI